MKYLQLVCFLLLGLGACSPPAKQQATNTVHIRWNRDPENLSPLVLANQNAVDAANLLYCGLLQLDYSTGTYAPALADSLPRRQLLGDSLLQLHYQLRRQATWDDGQPVLASDVAFTLKLLLSPGLPNEKARAQLGFIRDIKLDATNTRRFAFVCGGQAPELSIESGDFPILPEAAFDPTHILRRYSVAALAGYPAGRPLTPALDTLVQRYQQANLSRHPERLPGCGPYRLTAWQTNHFLTFVRKRRWWADTLRPAPVVLQAHSARLQFVVIPDDAAAALALRRHELEVLPQLSARDFQRLKASGAARQEFAFYSTVSYDVVMAGYNTRRAVLHDPLTRQALSRLFDPAHQVQGTQLGQGLLSVGLVHPHDTPYYNDSLSVPAYNPAQAQALLRRAGWVRQPTGWVRLGPSPDRLPERLALTLRYRASETTFRTIALQFKAAAALLAIPVELLPTEASALTTALREGDFDVYVRTLRGNPFAYNFATILHSRSLNAGNFTKFSLPVADRLIDAIAITSSPARKRLLLRRFQLLLQQEAPLVPLFFLPYRMAASQHLANLYPSALKPGYSAATVQWITQPTALK